MDKETKTDVDMLRLIIDMSVMPDSQFFLHD